MKQREGKQMKRLIWWILMLMDVGYSDREIRAYARII